MRLLGWRRHGSFVGRRCSGNPMGRSSTTRSWTSWTRRGNRPVAPDPKHVDQALDHAVATLAARARQAAEERERQIDADLARLRERGCEGLSVDGEWFYTTQLHELERGQRMNGPDHREEALAWAGRQMDRLDFLRGEGALDLFLGALDEFGAAQGAKNIEAALDHAGKQLRQAAKRREAQTDALSEDERAFFDKRLDVLEPSWRETKTAQPAHIDEALDYARTQLDALDRAIERRRVDIQLTPGDGYERLRRAGFESESRQRRAQALTNVEAYLDERLRSAGREDPDRR